MSYRAIEDHAVKMIKTFLMKEDPDTIDLNGNYNRPPAIQMFPNVEGQAVNGVNISQPEILEYAPDRVCIVSYKSGKDATAIGTARNHTRFYRVDWTLMLTCYFRPKEQIESDTLLIQSFNMTLGSRMRELYDELARRPTMSYYENTVWRDIDGSLNPSESRIVRYQETALTEPEDEGIQYNYNPWGRNSSQILGAEPQAWDEPDIFAGPMARYVRVNMEYRVREGYQLVPIL